jgi:hypothetical protein
MAKVVASAVTRSDTGGVPLLFNVSSSGMLMDGQFDFSPQDKAVLTIYSCSVLRLWVQRDYHRVETMDMVRKEEWIQKPDEEKTIVPSARFSAKNTYRANVTQTLSFRSSG